MQVLYSGVPSNGAVQSDPLQSLGGFVSGNQIPNGLFNAIFPAISRDHIKKSLSDTRLIVLRNNSGSALTNVKIYSTRGDYSSYLMAAVTPAHNATLNCDEYEILSDGHSVPYQAVLTSCEGLGNAITVASLAANTSVGVWIQRVVDLDEFTELDGKPGAQALTDDELITLLQSEDAGTRIDQGNITISW